MLRQTNHSDSMDAFTRSCLCCHFEVVQSRETGRNRNYKRVLVHGFSPCFSTQWASFVWYSGAACCREETLSYCKWVLHRNTRVSLLYEQKAKYFLEDIEFATYFWSSWNRLALIISHNIFFSWREIEISLVLGNDVPEVFLGEEKGEPSTTVMVKACFWVPKKR